MFKDIPQNFLFEIIARLPVKSLLRFRCVRKSWNTLISSPRFMNDHLVRSACNYLLIQTINRECLSLFCAETFAKCMDVEFPRHENNLYFEVYGSCNGLLCISYRTFGDPLYLWNPSIRKFKTLPKSLIGGSDYMYSRIIINFLALGFGFHCGENDYKVVRIVGYLAVYDVEVYSLNSDSWRKFSAVLQVSYGDSVQGECACLNGVVYWTIWEYSTRCNFILSFDMDSEIFQKVLLPDTLHQSPCPEIRIQVLEKSLSLLHLRKDEKDQYCDLWVMEIDTWKIICTVRLPACEKIQWPIGFTTNGLVHFATPSGDLDPQDFWHPQNLVLYDPKSQQVKDIGIKMFGKQGYIYGYRESLVFLN